MFIKLYFIAFLIFLGIDMIWLTMVAKVFYANQIGYIMTKNPNLVAAFIFYLIFIAGLVFFVIYPAYDKKMWVNALLAGTFFGLVTYATYDLTNLATIKDWPLIVTVVDLIWGMVLSASVSVFTYLVASKLGL